MLRGTDISGYDDGRLKKSVSRFSCTYQSYVYIGSRNLDGHNFKRHHAFLRCSILLLVK